MILDWPETAESKQMQRRGARRLILTIQVVMCFIVGSGSYDPREGKGFQLVSAGFVLEIMCV